MLFRMKKSAKVSVRTKVTIPMKGGNGTFFTFQGISDGKEHIAIGFGDWEKNPSPLVRVHSECLTGDVFSSGKCDCGEQLSQAIDELSRRSGILLYLRQEGRGIGLYNKLDAYVLQQQGHDTYAANRILGFGDDERDYSVACGMLRALGKSSVRLLSNNPEKKAQLEKSGIVVEELVRTQVFLKTSNRGYLEAKVTHTGHLIDLGMGLGAVGVSQ